MLQTSLSERYLPVGHLRQESRTCKIFDRTTSSEAWSVDSNLQCVTASAVLCIAIATPCDAPAEEPAGEEEAEEHGGPDNTEEGGSSSSPPMMS